MKKNIWVISLLSYQAAFAAADKNHTTDGKDKSSNPSDTMLVPELSKDFNFDETAINGAINAPDGFMLRGRNQQNLQQMIELRADFSKEIENSKPIVEKLIN